MELAQRLAEIKDALRRVTGNPVDASGSTIASRTLATGWSELDALCAGGLPRGRVSEIVGAASSGKTALALATAAHATAQGHLVAFVDPRRELYPPAAAALGVALERLLIVRPPAAPRSVARAGEILAQSRAFTLVLLDLPEGVRLDAAVTARLRRAAHASTAAIVLLATRRSTEDAALRLQAAASRETSSTGATTSLTRSAHGCARSQPTVGSRRVEITLLRGGSAPPGTSTEIVLTGPGIPVAIVSTAFRPAPEQAALFEAAPAAPPVLRAMCRLTTRKEDAP